MTALATSAAAAPSSGLDAAGLYERYSEQIYRYCLGRLRNREEAADALQNTFLRIHVALERGVVPQFESAWLYKIAHNVCLSRIEANGRRARVETPRDLDLLDESALAAPANEQEALAGLAGALAGLSPRLRRAILLREWQGLSHAEIAEAMGTTVPAVETLLCRARKQLAATLEQGGRRVRGSVAGLLDLLALRRLLSRCTKLLSGPGATKLALGVALTAVGASGLGAAVVVGAESGSANRAAPPGTQLAAAGPVSDSAFLSFLGRLDAGGLPGEAAAVGLPSAPVPGATTGSSSAAGASAVGSGATPGSATSGGAAQPSLVPGVSTPTLSAPSLSTPSLPTVTAPTVSVPTVTVPTVSVPTVTVPTVSVPTVTVPTVSVPTVTVPTAPTL